MAGARDRISQLPDEILGQILSLLPIKYIARAGALSKRWNYLFKNLQLRPSVLDFGEEFSSGKSVQEFVCSVNLHLRLSEGSKVKRFKLFFFPSFHYIYHLEKWVQFVVNQKIEDLELDLCLDPEPLILNEPVGELILDKKLLEHEEAEKKGFLLARRLIHVIVGCNSLTHLKISRSDFSIPVDFTGFSSLTELCLYKVNITDEMLERIISTCPSLETLNLRDCSHLYTIKICGPALQLKFLAVVDCMNAFEMEIYAPNLRSFHYNGDLSMYKFRNIASLVDAIICAVGANSYSFSYNRTKILAKLSHVKILTLCTAALWDMVLAEQSEPEGLPITFPNLHELQILMDVLLDDHLSLIYCFFRRCTFPSLEKLFIELDTLHFGYSNGVDTFIPGILPDQIFCNLKIAKIYSFCGRRNEISLVKFLLERAIALEYLVLVAPGANAFGSLQAQLSSYFEPLGPLSSVLEQLLSLPKASSEAQIILYEYAEDEKSLVATHTMSQYAPYDVENPFCFSMAHAG